MNRLYWVCPVCGAKIYYPINMTPLTVDEMQNEKINHLAIHIKELANAVNKK